MKIIAGIPAHNNWLCIASLIDGADEHVDEIIVVDDGSEDKIFSFIANRVAKAKVTVTASQSGLRALSRYAMDTIRTRIDGDRVKWEMVVNAADQGLRIKEVGIGIWSDGRISGGYD